MASARHCSSAMPSGSSTSKPITWAVKLIPASSSARPTAHGSASQVSRPSETRITWPHSLYSATPRLPGSRHPTAVCAPRGLTELTIRAISSRLFSPGCTTVSISEQSPRPVVTVHGQAPVPWCPGSASAGSEITSRAMTILFTPSICPHMEMEASSTRDRGRIVIGLGRGRQDGQQRQKQGREKRAHGESRNMKVR